MVSGTASLQDFIHRLSINFSCRVTDISTSFCQHSLVHREGFLMRYGSAVMRGLVAEIGLTKLEVKVHQKSMCMKMRKGISHRVEY